jgi:hypothetical protein
MGYRMLLAVWPDEVVDAAIFTRFRRSKRFNDGACRDDRCRPADVPRRPLAPRCADGCIPCKGCERLEGWARCRLVPIQRWVL